MNLSELIARKNLTKYQLSKMTKIPYSTIHDLLNGKTSMHKCTAETVFKIAKTLNVTVEFLLEQDNRIKKEE